MASEKITAIIDSVKELSVLELKELIDAYCEEFGVSAVAAAAPAAVWPTRIRRSSCRRKAKSLPPWQLQKIFYTSYSAPLHIPPSSCGTVEIASNRI